MNETIKVKLKDSYPGTVYVGAGGFRITKGETLTILPAVYQASINVLDIVPDGEGPVHGPEIPSQPVGPGPQTPPIPPVVKKGKTNVEKSEKQPIE
jgi:hypothetical protein